MLHLITLGHITLGRTPLDEGQSRRRGVYLHNTQHSRETNTHAAGGIRSKRETAEIRLRPRSHRNLVHVNSHF